jgi:hypothetical protein
MTSTRDNTPAGAPPAPERVEGTAPAIADAVPMLTTEQRLSAIESKLDELLAALATVANAAGLVGNAVAQEGLGGLVKMLPALMRGG